MGDLVTDMNAEQGGLRRLGARLAGAAEGRIAWLTDRRRDLAGVETDAAALVLVLGREHYVERRRTYPLQSWRDVAGVLRQELAAEPDTLAHIGPLHEDRREVVFYQPRPASVAQMGRAAWVVPESLLLARSLGPGELATVDRDGYRYFLAATGESQPAVGAIASLDLFALAVGLDAGQPAAVLDRAACARRLAPALWRLPPGAWLRFLRGSYAPVQRLAWRPLAVLAGVALLGYMALASAYLGVTTSVRERALENLGPEVEQLLKTQREVDRLDREQRAVADLLARRRDSHEIWRYAAMAWDKGARLYGMQLLDSRLTVRGTAPVATDVLAALARAPGVGDARFASPVTRNGPSEDFTIALTLLAPAAPAAAAGNRPTAGGAPSPAGAPAASPAQTPAATPGSDAGAPPSAAAPPAAAPATPPTAAPPAASPGTVFVNPPGRPQPAPAATGPASVPAAPPPRAEPAQPPGPAGNAPRGAAPAATEELPSIPLSEFKLPPGMQKAPTTPPGTTPVPAGGERGGNRE